MIDIKFPDGTIRQYNSDITGEDIALSISKTLVKSALAVAVDGVLQDLYLPIKKSCSISIITGETPQGLEIIRHDTAHLLAHAVKELYPEAQITIGPVIENGFYYDIAYKENFTPETLVIIEEKMREIERKNENIRREVWTRNSAKEFFEKIGEVYKSEIIGSIPEDQEISLYRQGDFIDLCRGPHAPSTGKNKAFKLTKIAGAYWRGDSKNQMLQRIYGTAWANKKDLEAYLYQIEEAEKRDHRKIGKELDLFHIEEDSPGMVFWHEKGWTIYRILEEYIREKLAKNDYKEVKTPVFINSSLWKKSGHWEKFLENMFISEAEEKIMALKPMSCPCHIQIFNHGLKSYRDLPLRMSEFGYCHRNEPSGSLHGLLRVRGFNQDDGHIFCSEDQITQETIDFCFLLREVYKELGFEDILIRFSDRPEKRAGRDELWDKAELSLKNAIDNTGLSYEMNPGEGAFYGPKLEFVLKDALGRSWQCGTLQLDFVLPERLNANYIGKDGNKHHPVMLHRAILGTFERFIGILIEHYAGRLPFWLSPIQIVVASITNEVDPYCQEVFAALKEKNIRTDLDISSDKINYKIRRHILNKIPYIVVLGKKEMETRTLSIRTNAESENQKSLTLEDFMQEIELLNNSKGANHK